MITDRLTGRSDKSYSDKIYSFPKLQLSIWDEYFIKVRGGILKADKKKLNKTDSKPYLEMYQ